MCAPMYESFIEYVKAFGQACRAKLWKILLRKDAIEHHIRAIQFRRRYRSRIQRNNDLDKCVHYHPLFLTRVRMISSKVEMNVKQIFNSSGIVINTSYLLMTSSYWQIQKIICNKLYSSWTSILKQFILEISTDKAKIWGSIGDEPVGAEILIGNHVREQVNKISYFRCNVCSQYS